MSLPQSLSHGRSRVAFHLWLWRNDNQGGHSSTPELGSTVHLWFISENSHVNVISLSSSHHLLMCFCRKVKATGVAFDDADEDWFIRLITAALPTMNFLAYLCRQELVQGKLFEKGVFLAAWCYVYPEIRCECMIPQVFSFCCVCFTLYFLNYWYFLFSMLSHF